MEQPNPLVVLWRILHALTRTRRPRPVGDNSVDHSAFGPVLESLSTAGLPAVAGDSRDLKDYLGKLASVQPDTLNRDEALAFWINLYNAGAVSLAAETFLAGSGSVLRTPGAFSTRVVTIAGEDLSLDAIEHAKIRRFGDARIHGALVCGALSCPTLRRQPFAGSALHEQLDEQMMAFLANGGAVAGDGGTVRLSRVFLWYGSDFVRPERMPTFVPASRGKTLKAIRRWLPDDVADRRRVEFQEYDWALGCQVR